MFLTVFTPTFNRAYIIPRLYESLCRQTNQDFEWVVIDDGSTDDTRSLVEKWKSENIIDIKYLVQDNGGKHRAINKGVEMSSGELFFIVDSDDYLTDDCVEFISGIWQDSLKENADLCGICGIRVYPDGKRVGGEEEWEELCCTPLEFRYKHKVRGDVAEILRTSILKGYKFPEIPGERFCPEALLFNRIATNYKIKYFYKPIYICEYLLDGLSAKITHLRMQSPVGSTLYYAEMLTYDIPFIVKIKASINYWRFWFCKSYQKKTPVSRFWLLSAPLGFLFHLIDLLR